MVNIHEKYLKQALRIRKDYLNISIDLSDVATNLENNKNSIEQTLEGLIDIREKSDTYVSDSDYADDIMGKLEEFEIQQKNIENIYKPLNDKMESLREEENELFNKIVKEYPHIDQKDLIIEILKYVEDKII